MLPSVVVAGAAKNFERRTAPLAFNIPAPCTSMLVLLFNCAVYCRIALTAFGVSFGLASSINATVPDTTGADMLVPLRLRYGLKFRPSPCVPLISIDGNVW
jgi:hypothetical protein